MKKVFVLTYLSMTYDNVYVEPQAFDSIDDAREVLQSEKKRAMEEYPEFQVEKDFEDEFVLSDKDYANFVEIKITECEIA